jgi:predicted SprT family Zn-dependent metalloprotease
MNQRSDIDTPNLKSHGVNLEANGTTAWLVREKNFDQVIAKIWLSDYEEKGPSVWLNIADFEPNQMHLLAETIRTVCHYALDRGKIHKINVRASQKQTSLLAALDEVGFIEKSRSAKDNAVRLVADRWDVITAMAITEMGLYLDLDTWSFGYDSARRRAGLCNYDTRHISVSRYLCEIHEIADVRQTVLHEIAHARCGPKAGHGRQWLSTAKSMGYLNKKFSGTEIAREVAPWQGVCPGAHEHFAYRKPSRIQSCAWCHPDFDERFLIRWTKRD